MSINTLCPIVGFAAFSGSGKTTLLTQLIPLLRRQHIRLALVKHAHHAFEVDYPEKDSFRMRAAGANQVLIASRNRWALMSEEQVTEAPSLQRMLDQLDQRNLDLILVEGFKRQPIPKIEIHRKETGHPLIFPHDPNVIALATDDPPPTELTIPHFRLSQPGELLAFILREFLPKSLLKVSA